MSNEVTVPAHSTLELTARAIREAWQSGGVGRTLVLDLDAVPTATAAGLGQVVALHAQIGALGGRLVVLNASDEVYEVFAVTGLTALLDIRRAEECPPTLLA